MEKIINGEIHTRDSIIEKHGRLVHWQCHRLKKYARALGQEYDDIASVGMFALVEAFERFDCDQSKTKFSSYATHIVWGRIHHHLSKCNTGLYYPRYIKELAQKIRKYELEDSPIDEIIEKTGVHCKNVGFALGYLQDRNLSNLNQSIHGEEGSLYLVDLVGEPDDISGLFVDEFLHSLTADERTAVVGLMEGKTLIELGTDSGVSRTSIWNAKERAKLKYLEFMAR